MKVAVNALGVALSLAVVAAALVLAAEGFAFRRVVSSSGSVADGGQLCSVEQGKLCHALLSQAPIAECQ